MSFNTPKLNQKLKEVKESVSPDILDKLEPVITRGQIIGSSKKIESQYDKYRFSKENPNPNWG